jgi:hypothetical protein
MAAQMLGCASMESDIARAHLFPNYRASTTGGSEHIALSAADRFRPPPSRLQIKNPHHFSGWNLRQAQAATALKEPSTASQWPSNHAAWFQQSTHRTGICTRPNRASCKWLLCQKGILHCKESKAPGVPCLRIVRSIDAHMSAVIILGQLQDEISYFLHRESLAYMCFRRGNGL